ncbi:DNA polymerase III subunit gamma/tau [Candidatus Acetothermia bacterium]|nr:DNA polymerase III subunit gamma/tau [Candidatus Acetothermia bacterium]MBI3642586.1 DNA polymerase III subunit gamma/tau [Candidatus Acetothermia bacterium]
MAEGRQPTYQSLYRKWRSQAFSDVVGQKYTIITLQNAIQKREIAHAYLFAGPRGTGKTSVARIFAKAINCPNQKDGEPCNTCSNCQRITRGSALDVIEIDGASNRGIDQIRQLREEVNFAPAECPYKIYIIDEVHMLTNEAFNALLKTLEEPPARVIFIFATTESHKVPATVLSRCQAFEFRQFAQEEIQKHLAFIAKEEGVTIEPAALETIARHAHGAMRDALVLLEQIISYKGRKEIVAQDLFEILGLPSEMLLDSFLLAILTGNHWRALEVIRELAERGRDLELFLRELIHYSRSRLIAEIESSQPKTSAATHQWVWLTDQLLELKREIRYAFDRRILFEVKVLQLTQNVPAQEAVIEPSVQTQPAAPASKTSVPDRNVTVVEEKAKPVHQEAASKPKAGKNIQQQPKEPPVAMPPTPSKSDDPRWDVLLERVRQENVRVHAILVEAVGRADAKNLFVEFPSGYDLHKQRLEQPESMQFLRAKAKEIYGDAELKIRFAQEPKVQPSPETSPKKPDLKEKSELVRQIFEGEILS